MKTLRYIICLLVLGTGSVAVGCSFGPDADIRKTAVENFPNYTYVVSGTLSDRLDAEGYAADYIFDIAGVHKGDVSDAQLTLRSPGHSCGFFGETDTHILLFANTLGTIDETLPKYFFDSVAEPRQQGTR